MYPAPNRSQYPLKSFMLVRAEQVHATKNMAVRRNDVGRSNLAAVDAGRVRWQHGKRSTRSQAVAGLPVRALDGLCHNSTAAKQ
jgi:hypothetical protein